MKIIQVIPCFGIGGAEIMCENLTYELVKQGYEIVVISLYDYHSAITDRMESAGIDLRYLRKHLGFDPRMIFKLVKILKAEKPDVVHTHLYVAKYAFIATFLVKINRVVHTVHTIATHEDNWLSRNINKGFYRAGFVTPVTLSEINQAEFIKEYKLSSKRVPVIYNGIDLSRCLIKKTYDINRVFKLICVARFSEVKNHTMLVEAFSRLLKIHPNCILQLIGSGELEIEIRDEVKTYNIESSVEFLGIQNNVFGHLHDADAFILTSLYEGIPISLIEAMGTGLPIIASNVGGIPNLLDDKSAILSDVTVESFFNAMTEVVSSINRRSILGRNALQRSKAFSIEKSTEKYIHIFQPSNGQTKNAN